MQRPRSPRTEARQGRCSPSAAAPRLGARCQVARCDGVGRGCEICRRRSDLSAPFSCAGEPQTATTKGLDHNRSAHAVYAGHFVLEAAAARLMLASPSKPSTYADGRERRYRSSWFHALATKKSASADIDRRVTEVRDVRGGPGRHAEQRVARRAARWHNRCRIWHRWHQALPGALVPAARDDRSRLVPRRRKNDFGSTTVSVAQREPPAIAKQPDGFQIRPSAITGSTMPHRTPAASLTNGAPPGCVST